jgi:hypothetical protein
MLAVHVTNHHIDLPPLVARMAAAHDPPLVARYRRSITSEAQRGEGKSDSEWMVLARTDESLGPVAWDAYWDRVKIKRGPVWRDDFANVLRVWKKDVEEE